MVSGGKPASPVAVNHLDKSPSSPSAIASKKLHQSPSTAFNRPHPDSKPKHCGGVQNSQICGRTILVSKKLHISQSILSPSSSPPPFLSNLFSFSYLNRTPIPDLFRLPYHRRAASRQSNRLQETRNEFKHEGVGRGPCDNRRGEPLLKNTN